MYDHLSVPKGIRHGHLYTLHKKNKIKTILDKLEKKTRQEHYLNNKMKNLKHLILQRNSLLLTLKLKYKITIVLV